MKANRSNQPAEAIAVVRLVALNNFQNVAVHHEREYPQQEDQPDLHETLLHSDAQIAADRSFDHQQQNVATIQNRNGEQVEQAQIETDNGHQSEKRHRSALGGLTGNTGDAQG